MIRLGQPILKIKRTAQSGGSEIPNQKARLTAVSLPFWDYGFSVFDQGRPSRISPTDLERQEAGHPLSGVSGCSDRGLKTRGPISRLYDVDITPHDLRVREIQFEPLLTNPRHCQFITPLMA